MELEKLNDQDLENSLVILMKREREILHLVILHIREIDMRRIYLAKARSSLFEYLTLDLGYSNASAQRRIEAARMMTDVPRLADKIQKGSINLSQVGELRRAIKQKESETTSKVSSETKRQIFSQIENTSVATTQQIIARTLDLNLKPSETKKIQKDHSVHLQISLSKEQFAKLEQCKNLTAHILKQKNKTHEIANILEVLADQFFKSREIRNADILNGEPDKIKANHLEISPTSTAEINGKNKSITAKTRRIVLNKYSCCQFEDVQSKKTCSSQFALEVEHKVPLWAGGTNKVENLTTLCSQHNKYKYRNEAHLRFR